MEASQLSILKDVTAFWWVLVVAVSGISVKLGVYIWDRHNKDIASINDTLKKQGQDMSTRFDRLETRINEVEKSSTPLAMYEQNRKEMRQGQINIFTELNNVSRALARIEGKLQSRKED